MSKFLTIRVNRFAPFGLIALAAAVLLAPAAADATPFVMTLTEQGGNVVGAGSGILDLTGLTQVYSSPYEYPFTVPSFAFILVGPTTPGGIVGYGPISGPGNFGPGSTDVVASSGSGDLVGVCGGSGCSGGSQIDVPAGYTTGNLSGTSTWDNATFASLGVTPGTYVWTWGTGADQRFTLIVSNAVGVPEPAALGMFGVGVLLIGAFVGLRRRVA